MCGVVFLDQKSVVIFTQTNPHNYKRASRNTKFSTPENYRIIKAVQEYFTTMQRFVNTVLN